MYLSAVPFLRNHFTHSPLKEVSIPTFRELESRGFHIPRLFHRPTYPVTTHPNVPYSLYVTSFLYGNFNSHIHSNLIVEASASTKKPRLKFNFDPIFLAVLFFTGLHFVISPQIFILFRFQLRSLIDLFLEYTFIHLRMSMGQDNVPVVPLSWNFETNRRFYHRLKLLTPPFSEGTVQYTPFRTFRHLLQNDDGRVSLDEEED